MKEDVFSKPLMRSCVGDHIWELLDTDPERFKKEVKDYFAKAYPGWTVIKANRKEKIIWLRDDRAEE